MKFNLGKKISYGILDLGQNAFLNLVGFYFLFFMTDIVKISPALAGLALLIGKLWDAITDPVIGHWSDRTVTRMGRRRPFIFSGSISILFFIFAMFTVPELGSEIAKFAYITLFYVLASTSFTLMNIPYQAMLPELTTDFDERTSVIAWRMAFAVIGTFIGAGAVAPLVQKFGENGWSHTALVIGAVVTVTGLITVFFIREPNHTTKSESLSFFHSIKHVLIMKPFLLILFPWVLFNLGIAIVQATLVYFFTYIIGEADLFNGAIFALLGFALLAIPLYVKLSQKIDKKNSYITGMIWMLIMLMLFAFLSPLLPVAGSVVLMAFSGIGLGAHYVMPHSILPDVIEWDAVRSGERREGIFASLWTFSVKLGQALALGITGLVLYLSGYQSDQIQSDVALWGIRLLMSIIPAIIILSGIIILRKYPISREFYEEKISGV